MLLNQRLFCYSLTYLLLTVLTSFAHHVIMCGRGREGRGVTAQRRVCACVRGRRSHNCGLCSNTYELHHCVCHMTLFPSQLELMVKLRTLLDVFTFIFKAKDRNCGKGRYISNKNTCGVRPITIHWVSWPIRTNLAFSEGETL